MPGSLSIYNAIPAHRRTTSPSRIQVWFSHAGVVSYELIVPEGGQSQNLSRDATETNSYIQYLLVRVLVMGSALDHPKGCPCNISES